MANPSSVPVVVILTMPDDSKSFRGNRNNFIDIILTGKKLNIPVYIVTTKDLNLRRRQMLGYEYLPEKQSWNRCWVPFPDIIYNRIPYREDEHLPEVKRLIEECIRHPHVRLFNPSFFNKWELFEWLSRSKATRPHIPHTRRYKPNMKILSLLKQHSFLYLKPERGKAGTGIMRIRRIQRPRVSYTLSVQEAKSSQTMYFTTLAKLKEHLDTLVGDQAYIVQQGILLSSLDNRPFDLRVLLQKNQQGHWSVTGVGARMAGESSITTHVPRGGSIENPKRLLTSSFGATRAKRILKRLERTSLLLAKQIELRSGHQLGEMSMDLGIDRKAKIWFFEANSKPMKFDEPHIRQKSLIRFFDYCRYLVKHQKKSRGRGNHVMY